MPGFFKALGRLLLICLTAATGILWLGLIHEGFLRTVGTLVQARLISIHEVQDSDGGYSHYAKYRYALRGIEQNAQSSISYTAWHRLREELFKLGGKHGDTSFFAPIPSPESGAGDADAFGQAPESPPTIDVRAYTIGPVRYSRVVEHEWAMLYLLIPAIFAPLLACLTAVTYLATVVRPRRQRWLYTHGTAVTGMITNTRRMRVKHSELLYADFNFAPNSQRSLLQGTTMLAGEKELASAVVGKAVIVLYDPAKPRHCTVYEYGGYAWA